MKAWRMVGRTMALVSALAASGCVVGSVPTRPRVGTLGGVTIVRPRCVEVRSCLLGQVVEAETATPLARAAVFLVKEREPGASAASDDALRIVRLTDDQGVFTVADAPAGRYSVSVYKNARRISASGLELGSPGTLVVPIRLPPPA